MSLLGRLVFDAGQTFRRSRSLALLKQIRSAAGQSRERILADQFRKLSKLLAEAEAHVPYYRNLFQQLGLRSYDIRSLEEFSQFPVLTKQIVRDHLNELVHEKYQHKLVRAHSGGSTGVPLTFYRSVNDQDLADAGMFRGLLQCGWTPGEMIAYFWGGNEHLYSMSKFEFEARQQLRRRYQFDPFRSGTAEMAEWWKKWPIIRPRVIFGYTSTIARFASYLAKEGLKPAALRGAFVTAEKLLPEQREMISNVFQCHVYDFYGSSEVRNIATECSMGSMHVNSDFVVLETDRESKKPGLGAPFIVTALHSTAMPFIRYRNEDSGELRAGVCECGNQFPLMQLGVSRLTDNFVLSNGQVVHGEFFTHLMYGSEGVENFQFHQASPDRIDLWIVPTAGSGQARENSIRRAAEQLKQFDPAVSLVVRETTQIPLSASGKHRFTRSDVPVPMMESSQA